MCVRRADLIVVATYGEAFRVEGEGKREGASRPLTVAAGGDLWSALSDVVASSDYPLGVSPSEFMAWYATWWPAGNDAKPGTGLMRDWFADAEAEVHDGRTRSDHTMVVLALISEMQGAEHPV